MQTLVARYIRGIRFWLLSLAGLAMILMITPGKAVAAVQSPGGNLIRDPGTVRAVFHPAVKVVRHVIDAALARYVVKSGDTLSGISAKLCGPARDWTGIYAASRKADLTAWNANDLQAGQQLAIDCAYVPGMLGRAATTSVSSPVLTSYNVQAPAYTPRSEPATTYRGSTSYQQCVISRESGGDSQVMNGSGHYGLYQFSYDTWKAYGGNPADFGHASVAEQNRAYWAVVAAGATYGTWSEWDGC